MKRIEVYNENYEHILTITDEDIRADGFMVDLLLNRDNTIELGAIAGGAANFTIIDSGKYKNFLFRDKNINIFNGDENLGFYRVAEALRSGTPNSNYEMIEIEAYNSIIDLDKSYKDNDLLYPTTIKKVVEDIGENVGFRVNPDILNGHLEVDIDNKELYTYRDILSFAAVIVGGFAFIDDNNDLKLKTYNSSYNRPLKVSGDMIKDIKIGEELKITGVVYNMDSGRILKGSNESPLIIPNNPFINSLKDPDDFINYIYNIYKDMKYTPLTLTMFYNKGVKPGQAIEGDGFKTFITAINLNPGVSLDLSTSSNAAIDYLRNESDDIKNS